MAKVLYCNKCGKKLDMWDVQQKFSLQRQLGYGSKYDSETIDIDLCIECMDKLIGECIISPIVSMDECEE